MALLVAVVLLAASTIVACKEDESTDPTDETPGPPSASNSSPDPTPSEADDDKPDNPAPRPIEIGDELEGTIKFPKIDDAVPYETDWYVFEGEADESVTFRVEATDESQLRPMISVLIPGEGSREEWEQVDARRAADDEPSVELTLEPRSDGTRLVAIDDARNAVDGHVDAPVGGESFGYRLRVTPAR